MRKEYYIFLDNTGIRDFFSLIDEIPYSKKLNILEKLNKIYDTQSINKALNDYEMNYYRLHRVRLNIIENVLKGLCQKYFIKNNF